jgi:hypothetical protein
MIKKVDIRPWTATEIYKLKGLAKQNVGAEKIAKSESSLNVGQGPLASYIIGCARVGQRCCSSRRSVYRKPAPALETSNSDQPAAMIV